MASPSPSGGGTSVTADSATSDWAVGLITQGGPDSPGTDVPIIEHWNGRHSSVAATPNPPSVYLNLLGGVVAASKRNARAVGTADWQSTLIEHCNGTSRSD